jgi:hypothetical protein
LTGFRFRARFVICGYGISVLRLFAQPAGGGAFNG